MARRNIPAGLTALGYEKITTNSTVKTLNSTNIVGNTFLISVETQSARIRFDNGTPAASTGILLLAANSPFWVYGVKGSQIKITGAASGSILNVVAFKNTGE
jgi:hypothetical protein